MKKTIKFLTTPLIYLAIFLILVMPLFSFAAQDPSSTTGLVPCDNSTAKPCDFNALLTLINTVIRFVIFDLVVPIAAVMFAYAGFLMITSGGSTESRSKAKKIFTNAVIGLVFAVGAWLIIRTILSILGYDGAWIGF